jgi:uncharacterized protein (DUF934 family)
MSNTIDLIANKPAFAWAKGQRVLQIANDTDVESLQAELPNTQTVELHFPKFSDGRAYSQAVQLRRRHGFKGEIRATGDVLIDQLVQMQRTGFSSAVLRADQDAEHGLKLLSHFSGFYQGDAQTAQPLFAKATA